MLESESKNSSLDIDINHNDDKMPYSPDIEYSSIYSLFGSVLGLSSVKATTVANLDKSGISGHDDRINLDETPSSNDLNEEQIRFDTINPLLSLKLPEGLSRLVISSHATLTSSHCSFFPSHHVTSHLPANCFVNLKSHLHFVLPFTTFRTQE